MKKRIKRIILFSVFAIIISALIWFFQFYSFGYMITVPFRQGYTKIAENVYVHKDYSVQNEEILSMISTAKVRVNDFFGEIRSNPTLIFCDDKKERTFVNSGATSTYLKLTYCSIGLKEHCNVDVIAHELTHAETHERIISFWDCFNFNQILKIPIWFNEGLATQNDYREKYSEERWQTETNGGKTATALSDMDTPKKFYSGDAGEDGCSSRFHYMCAKHEVAGWIKKHGKSVLFKLLDGVKKGESFEKLYFK